MSCAALIFDLDGVLVDSLAFVEGIWAAWAARHGLEEQEVLRTCHGRRTIETIRSVAPDLDAEQETEAFNTLEAAYTEGIKAMEGAAGLLASLPPGRWAVATSGNRATATARLKRAGLPVPSVLVTADDVRRGKPDPEVFLLAAQRLGADPRRCVVVEDAPAGIQAAAAGGMGAIGLDPAGSGELSAALAVIARLGDLRARAAEAGLELEVNLRP